VGCPRGIQEAWLNDGYGSRMSDVDMQFQFNSASKKCKTCSACVRSSDRDESWVGCFADWGLEELVKTSFRLGREELEEDAEVGSGSHESLTLGGPARPGSMKEVANPATA
jgi:hypothetical protein